MYAVLCVDGYVFVLFVYTVGSYVFGLSVRIIFLDNAICLFAILYVTLLMLFISDILTTIKNSLLTILLL